ncbi:hypothetical protein [Hyphomicrobium sp.]|uniref:hypothetical protein n=1 Tax=Hyphomicrobium sp. TaxID=82 RepID=UPI001D4D151B|nr:hypothetical protein [Hyphomicrobium sp.]MBY0561546.1 hypothetical protein [Hyphomicrobium sp.]
MNGTSILYHFECPVCGYDETESGQLATEGQRFCGLCAADCGPDEVLIKWPEIAGKSREEARAMNGAKP